MLQLEAKTKFLTPRFHRQSRDPDAGLLIDIAGDGLTCRSKRASGKRPAPVEAVAKESDVETVQFRVFDVLPQEPCQDWPRHNP